ncbi:MAG: K(+)-transporting ATPase subunit C [Sphingobacteriales bacterium]|nr:MAG: K(+)-transporting ATPase subunit C [Sphingobacteriales bacterium]TAF80337.1 MAG: K(+)-transporting ATPase subunit C [Sphingobacteriales bacterium]
MKTNLLPAVKLTVLALIILCVIYPATIWGIAQFVPNKGKGETVLKNGKVVGYKRIGQKFTQDKYFNSRPSAVAYNAAGSAGSNKGPSNPDYLIEVQARIDTFLVHNPTVNKADIPAELVTASGSGLDPNLSPDGAKIQIARIAKIRNLSVDDLNKLVDDHTEKPFLGPQVVNVLEINLAVEKLRAFGPRASSFRATGFRASSLKQ